MSALVWGPLAFLGLLVFMFALAVREQRSYDAWRRAHAESWEARANARNL